ncbi:hypothetical protein CDL15_Pgr017841 [Punica granatum]|uniref:Glyoxylate/hydroxypyruvate reductase HPR3-like n=1 Tax=Punica granatum TaxID=22663 RepID=A0A218WHH7_PUNGR|nr:hypothetical protein CDL15_Pgr017841 [Punica granatum]
MEEELPVVLVHRRPSATFVIPLKARLQAHFRVLDPCDSADDSHTFLARHGRSVRALLCASLAPLPADTLELLPSLELVVISTAGIDHVDLQFCRRRGITVTNASAALAEDAADHAVALLIDVLRRITAADRFVRAGSWPVKGEYPLGSKLRGKRVGIVGLGTIGSGIVKRLAALGCIISYTSRSKKPTVPFAYIGNVVELASNSDALIVCCPLTQGTHHIISEEVMRALGKGGVVVNVGRGALIDEERMVELLVRGELGGAGLDVFENEPDVPKELLELDHVILTPHSAVTTPESFRAVEDLIVDNFIAFFSNKPLLSVVQL